MTGRLRRYGVAIGLTAAAIAVVVALEAQLGRSFFSVLTLAVMLSAWYGGMGPGVLSSLLGAMAINYFFQEPRNELRIATVNDAVQLIVFTCAAVLVSALTSRWDKARIDASQARRQALHDEVFADLSRRGATERDREQALKLIRDKAISLTGADYAVVTLDRESPPVPANESGAAIVAVPLVHMGRSIGTLVLGWPAGSAPSSEQVGIGETFAGYAAAILDNALSRAELEEQRSEAEALAELVRQGAAERDPDAAMSFICERGCRLLGADYGAFTIVEDAAQRVWHGAYGVVSAGDSVTRGRPQGTSLRALEAGHALVVEHIQEQPDLSRFHAREGGHTIVAAPCIGPGDLRCVLHMGWRRDVTIGPGQLRLAEALAGYAAVILENARAHAKLQQEAETVRLANEQLTHLDQMKSDLISNVSHELRTPLGSIRAFSELLLNADVDSETRFEFTNIINAESERLTRLVSNLLDLSRIQEGVTWHFRALDVRKELEVALAALRPAAEEKRLELRLEVIPNVGPVRADPDGLQQALVNLISNAVKFTAEGQVAIRAAPENGGVRVSVIDSGPGMTEEEQSHIFDRFYQAGNILTSKPAGSGLGLAITKEILAQHGAEIQLESTPGQGSTFSFVLPLAGEAV